MTSYRSAEAIPEDVMRELGTLDPIVARLLFNRGVKTKADADAFLSPDFDLRHDPFLMTDMERAVSRVLHAIKNNERIAIWSDYDCDGIPGAVLFHDFFSAIGFANFENYIPHRHDEGFGLNTEGIDKLIERETKLIITLDCGTADVAHVAHAQKNSVDVIVTDHHEPGNELPPAFAILNPKRDDAYPFRELCGSGVAWKLIEALILRGGFGLKEGQEKWWLDMVGLATMADMVSLTGENRVLAHFGLTVLRKTKRKGLHQLFRALKLDARNLSDDDVGFSIAPRVNAASRMGHPHDAFNVFIAHDDATAAAGARHLEQINNERKGVVGAMVKEIKKRLAEREPEGVVVIGNPEWRPSLAGLVANSLVLEYRRPAFVWGRDGRGVLKGSCRSDGTVSVVSLMESARELFIDFGGHHASGGFAVREECIHNLGKRLSEVYLAGATQMSAVHELSIDADLALTDVTDAFHRNISKLSPFGVGNTKPLFRFCDITPKSVALFGKAKEHTKVLFEGGRGNLEAIAFFKSPDSFTKPLQENKNIDLIAHVEKSFFMGRPQLRLRVVDVL